MSIIVNFTGFATIIVGSRIILLQLKKDKFIQLIITFFNYSGTSYNSTDQALHVSDPLPPL